MPDRPSPPRAICRTYKAFGAVLQGLARGLLGRGRPVRDFRLGPAWRPGASRVLARTPAMVMVAVIVAGSPPAPAQQWTPPIQKVPHLFVQTDVLGIRGGVTRRLGTGTIEASAGRPGTLTLPLDLGPALAEHPASIEITITQNAGGESKVGLTVSTTVVVASPSGQASRIHRERVAEVDEGRSFFHQAYDNAAQGTAILLTMTPETRIVPELVKAVGSAPIVFDVSLARITEAGDIPLEDNVLRTMEGSPVSYSFRIATASSAPVEAAAPEDARPAGGEPSTTAAPAEGDPTVADPGNQPDQGNQTKKPSKKKKTSKKERDQETLAAFQRARDAEARASAPAPDAGSSADAAPPPAGAAAPDGAGAHPPAGSAAESALPAPPPADELELTLLPHRVEAGILLIEATLRGRAPAGAAGGEHAALITRTHAVSPQGAFDITVSGVGSSGAGSYRFHVVARF